MKEGGEENGFSVQSGGGYGGADMRQVRSNPATNDWIPSVEEDHKVLVYIIDLRSLLKTQSQLYFVFFV